MVNPVLHEYTEKPYRRRPLADGGLQTTRLEAFDVILPLSHQPPRIQSGLDRCLYTGVQDAMSTVPLKPGKNVRPVSCASHPLLLPSFSSALMFLPDRIMKPSEVGSGVDYLMCGAFPRWSHGASGDRGAEHGGYRVPRPRFANVEGLASHSVDPTV